MLHREWDTRLYEIVDAQLGYFMTAEVRQRRDGRALAPHSCSQNC